MFEVVLLDACINDDDDADLTNPFAKFTEEIKKVGSSCISEEDI